MKVERQVLDAARELERLRSEVKATRSRLKVVERRHEAQKEANKLLRRELRELGSEALELRRTTRAQASRLQGTARLRAWERIREFEWEADRQRRRSKVFLEAVCLLEEEANKREWVTSDEFNALWRRQRARAEAIDREAFSSYSSCTCVPGRSATFGILSP